ncbi:hypothetical protein [Cohnella fermenti]|uniref:Heparinase n=1 Tax=Cohnella fermenti TaxID=2565925 RepID=A0A4S4BUJ0_9BACL|nr:hypothetical protein [Cohnella fermenti]THF78769.1 hypothetical protein E6C55_13690 [Cohnella fermenti]
MANNTIDWEQEFQEKLRQMHESYNPENRLLRCPFSSPGYHTKIKQADFVHPTRQAADYALALLDGGDPSYRQRAFDILQVLVSLQDQDPSSPTYGIWSWFWEEPLPEMAPPDWNWADFIGKRLLFVLHRHDSLLPEQLRLDIRQAVRNSCEAIIKRNIGPHYTNIAIMGSFVTIIAGELLEDSRYLEYGLDRLRKLLDHTRREGALQEYNSPPYSSIAITELSAIAVCTKTEQARQMAEELLDIAWGMTAEHFHPLLKQWSGPHARSYSIFTERERLTFLQMAFDGRLDVLEGSEPAYDPEWHGQGVRCPDSFLPLFAEWKGNREISQKLPDEGMPLQRKAYTYMTRDYSLGSFNHQAMWNQCRNLQAYIAGDGGEAISLRLRVLHEDYDFCSAVIRTEQRGGNALYGIRFSLDGGDTHVNLDPIHGRTKARDLRIRLEISNRRGAGAPRWERLADNRYEATIGSTKATVTGLFAAMSGFGPFRWETSAGTVQSRSGEYDGSFLDLVLHAGEEREVDFHAMEEALLGFALSLTEPGQEPPTASAERLQDRVGFELADAAEPLRLTLGVKPGPVAELFG